MTPFIRNEWYAAAWAAEVGSRPLARRILGEDVVLYRTAKGTPAALTDRCAHRFAPLSMGTVQGDHLVCGYHGVGYDCSGQCVRVPGQERIPPGLRVRSYPVAEKFGLVWVWPGDPDRASHTKLIDIPQFAEDALSCGYHRFESNYLNIADNLLDPAHTSYVHRGTIGNAAAEDIPVQAEESGDVVVAGRWINDSPPVPIIQRFARPKGNVDRWQLYYLKVPCTSWVDFGALDAGLPHTDEEKARAAFRVLSYAMLTPESERSTHYFWFQIRNFARGDEAVTREFVDLYRRTFDEDQVLLEAIQRIEDRPSGPKPVRIASDGGLVRMRRILERRLEEERRLDRGTRSELNKEAAS